MTGQIGGSREATLSGSREAILGRVRGALTERDRLPHPGASPGRPVFEGHEEVLAAFAQKFSAAGGEVIRFGSVTEAQAWAGGVYGEMKDVVQSPETPPALRAEVAEVRPDLARLGVSLALAAAADTGSVVLSSREGRRLQLLPRVLLVWVDPSTVFARLEEALDSVRDQDRSALAVHSGPSKSADIGRVVVTGVHGPGRIIAGIVDLG
jgi:L-lactate dehydrogenase complex protein LldG